MLLRIRTYLRGQRYSQQGEFGDTSGQIVAAVSRSLRL
jgi:hypothetical protein